MAQLLLAVVITVAVVLFGLVNTHHVVLRSVVGDPVQIRLAFLLAITFMSGSLTTFFYQMISRVRRRSETRRNRLASARRARAVEAG